MARAWMLALLLAACLVTPAGATVPRDWVGVVADGPLTAGSAPRTAEWKRIGTSGAGFVRTAFYWRTLEPKQRQFSLSPSDRTVLLAARNGLSVLPVLQGTPAWARLTPKDAGSPPADPQTFAPFVTALVARYGPQGTLWSEHPDVTARPIRTWQIWNEPSLSVYWSVQPFAPSYVALLKVARAALTAADPEAKLLLAGLPNRSWDALDDIYAAGGKGLFDAVALHPYTVSIKNMLRVVTTVRQTMAKHGDSAMPVWLTEISWPASRDADKHPEGFETTDHGQAHLLRSTLTLLAAQRIKLKLAHVVWYTWLSKEGAQTPFWSSYSGLRRIRKGKTVTAPSLAVFTQTIKKLRGV